MALTITDATFQALIDEGKPVVIDFWAEWCGPCRMVGPIIEELATEYEGRAYIGKVDVDENTEIAAKFGIRNIPTILLYKNGELVKDENGVVEKLVGSVTKEKLTDFVEKHLN